jgi:hypothetical protein
LIWICGISIVLIIDLGILRWYCAAADAAAPSSTRLQRARCSSSSIQQTKEQPQLQQHSKAILFLSLEDCSEQLLKGVHGQLLHTLDDHCTVKLITTRKEARAALEDPRVLVAVANDKMAAVVTKPFLQRGEARAAALAAEAHAFLLLPHHCACFSSATAEP